ncbi:MAG TPA: hypothetical protein ENN77_02105 [Candidatus Wirthbacteria bacterium]|nr:hypothetical protein [Candidatus Wirthbacteria bacterium]
MSDGVFEMLSLKKNQNQSTAQSGLTMVETLVMVAIFGLIVPTIINFIWNGFYMNRIVAGQALNQSIARHAMDRMTGELRDMSIGAGNQYPLQICSPLVIEFYSDLDLDGQIEKVRYFIQDYELKRGVIKPSGTPATYDPNTEVVSTWITDVLNDSAHPLFEYYGGNYAGSGVSLSQPVSCAEVRAVGIWFQIDTVIERQPGPFNLHSMVQLRNLKTNL